MPIPSKRTAPRRKSRSGADRGIWQAGRKIVIKEIEEGENIAYYRDENDVHYVPKRKLEDIIIKK